MAKNEIKNRSKAQDRAFSSLPDDKLRKMAVGKTSVFFDTPAKITVAPNSPKALAKVSMPAATTPCLAWGRVIFKKTKKRG
jgi:hypothetical protein